MKDQLEAELSQWCGVKHRYTTGGKHEKLIIEVGDRSRALPFTKTRTDFRGQRNKISDLRRALRDLGAEKL
ncbi:MAG: hypothetical protein ABFE07_20575 [Armatimonadia bacterium]